MASCFITLSTGEVIEIQGWSASAFEERIRALPAAGNFHTITLSNGEYLLARHVVRISRTSPKPANQVYKIKV